MKILLVNSNPVVSRLTALSARKESVRLDEIKDISALKKSDYDIVFVDFESYTQELSNLLSNSDIPKRVLFYTQDDKEKPEIFNITILKPFLPSEVSAVLRERKIEIEENPPTEEYTDLNKLIAEKKDDLAPINISEKKDKTVESKKTKVEEKRDELELEPINLIEDEILEKKRDNIELEPITLIKEETVESQKPKIEVKKRKNELEPITLIDDKITEEELLAEFSQSGDKLKKIEKSPDLGIVELSLEEAKDESKLFELDIDEDSTIKDSGLLEIDNNKKSSDTNELLEIESRDNNFKDEILDLDMDSKNEVNFDTPPKEQKSTKILDGDEISNIKSLLDSDKEIDKDISLEDVMTTTAPQVYTKVEKKNKKRKKRKAKKEIENKKLSSEIITDTLSALPIDDLRRLLLGTKIHITIEFPKEF